MCGICKEIVVLSPQSQSQGFIADYSPSTVIDFKSDDRDHTTFNAENMFSLIFQRKLVSPIDTANLKGFIMSRILNDQNFT